MIEPRGSKRDGVMPWREKFEVGVVPRALRPLRLFLARKTASTNEATRVETVSLTLASLNNDRQSERQIIILKYYYYSLILLAHGHEQIQFQISQDKREVLLTGQNRSRQCCLSFEVCASLLTSCSGPFPIDQDLMNIWYISLCVSSL